MFTCESSLVPINHEPVEHFIAVNSLNCWVKMIFKNTNTGPQGRREAAELGSRPGKFPVCEPQEQCKLTAQESKTSICHHC